MNWKDIPLNTPIGKEPYDRRKNLFRPIRVVGFRSGFGTESSDLLRRARAGDEDIH